MMDAFGNSGNGVFKLKGADIWNKGEDDPLTHRYNPTEDVFKNKENDILKHSNQDIFKNKNVQFTAFPNDTDHEHIVRHRTVMVSSFQFTAFPNDTDHEHIVRHGK